MSLRSPLVPIAVLLLSFGQLVLRGHDGTRIVGENLPNPRVSPGWRLVDLVHPTGNQGRIYEVTFEHRKPEASPPPENARLLVQLSSAGRTRILVIRPAGSIPSRRGALLDVLLGRGGIQVVADRKWIDFGPLPPNGAPLRNQVVGLLPGPYGFVELNKASNPLFGSIRIERPEAPATTVLTTFPRYRLAAPAPVPARETFARFFFFISISRVLQITGLVALGLLIGGWRCLGAGRIAAAVSCLIPSVVLLHAVCLPPMQGADETSHGATIEALLFRGMPVRERDPYPRSWSLAAEWLEQDRVQFQPDEPLPIDGSEARTLIASRLGGRLEKEAREPGVWAPLAGVQGVNSRSLLFFRPFELLGPVLRPLSLIERISAYRILSTLSGLFLYCLGVLFLRRSSLDAGIALSYGVLWLLPYMVITVASISNYATAIGLGSLLSAFALVSILSVKGRERVASAGLLVASCWVGVAVWPDFILLALIATAVVGLGVLDAVTRSLRPIARWSLLTAAATFLTAVFLLFALVSARARVGNVGTRLPADLPRSLDWNVFWIAVAVAAPLTLASLAALGVRRLSRLPPERTRRVAVGTSLALGLLIVTGFLLTPWTLIPYENEHYPYAKLVLEHFRVFLSNSFAWDQDVLSWKFYVGAGGWHDLLLPDAIYAAFRWLSVAVILGLPILILRESEGSRIPRERLIMLSGLAASLSIVSLTIRYLAPANAWGRFALPWWPLVAVPLVTIARPGHDRLLAAIVATATLLHLWFDVAVLGTRYAFGAG